MKPSSTLVLLHLPSVAVGCRPQPTERVLSERPDTVVVGYDYRKLRFNATSEIRETPSGRQEISVAVAVTNPGPDHVVLHTTMSCAIRVGAISERNPEVHLREPDRVCPDLFETTVIPPDTTLVPPNFHTITTTRFLLPDSMPDGPYRIVPELIFYGPSGWDRARVDLLLEAGRANLQRAP